MNADIAVALAAAMGCAAALTGAAYFALCLYIAHRLVRCPARPEAASAAAELPYRPVRFPARDGRALIAALYHAAPEPSGAVILVHGRGGLKTHVLSSRIAALVDRLAKQHLSVLIIDLRGHGQSTPAKLTFGIKERHDVLGAVDWLKRKGYRRGKIAAVGASMGGVAVLCAAVEEPAIGAVICDSAFADFGSVANIAIRAAVTPIVSLLVLQLALKLADWLCGAPLAQFHPARIARELNQPLLVVHAAGDPVVPAQHALELSLTGRAQTWITEGNGHVTSFLEFPDEYMKRVQVFLESALFGDQADGRSLHRPSSG